MEQLLLGFSLAAWLYTTAAVTYALWKYVYQPWQVVRSDQKALDSKIQSLQSDLNLFKEDMGKRKAISFTPEQVAGMEREQRMRLLQGAMERGIA